MEKAEHGPGLNSWRHFLQLGEDLLQTRSTSSQILIIKKAIESHVRSKVTIQLVSPAYPLPGENANSVINLSREKVHTLTSQKFVPIHNVDFETFPEKIELPIITEDHLLAVVEIEFLQRQSLSTADLEYIEGILTHSALAMQVHRQEVIKIWRSEQLGLVKKVTSQITNYSNLKELCTQIAKLIKKTYQYFNVGIYTTNDDLHSLSLSGSSQDLPTNGVVEFGFGMVGNVAKSENEIYAPDVRQEPRYRLNLSLPETRSEVTIPIKMENQLLGVLNIESDQLDAFRGLDLFVLHALADNIAVAIMNSKLYANLQRRADQIKAVLDVSHVLNSILDPEILLKQVVQLIHDRFNHPFVHLYLVQNRTKKIRYQIGYGGRVPYLEKDPPIYNISDEKGIIPWVARNKKSLLVNDVDNEPLYRPGAHSPIPTHSELTCPMLFGKGVIGVLDIQSDRKNAFDESDLSLIEMLSSSIAITIHNANLFRSEQWRRKVADSFRDVAILMTENTPIEKLLDTILLNLQKNLPCDASAIWLLKHPEKSNTSSESDLYLAAAHGVDADKVSSLRSSVINLRKWLNSALGAREPKVRKASDPFGPLGAANEYPPSYSSIAMPLRVGDQILGLLTLAHHRHGQYGSEAGAIVTTFASYASIALQNANSFSNSQIQAWTSTVLLQVAESTQNLTTIEDIFQAMARLIPLLIGVKECGLFLWEDDSKFFSLKASYNIETKGDVIIRPDASPAFNKMMVEKSYQIINDPDSELKCPEMCDLQNLGTTLLLPLMSRNEVLGALLISHERLEQIGYEASYDDQTLNILQGITHQLSVAVENIQLLELKQEEAYVTAVLLQVAQAVVSQNDLNEVLGTIIHLMPILVGIDACVLFLSDSKSEKFIPIQSYAGSRQKEKELLTKAYSFGKFELLDWVRKNDTSKTCYLSAEQLDPMNWQNVKCSTDLPANNQTSTNILMGFPISYRGESFGVLLARELDIKTRFHEKRLEIISGISQQIALAIQNDHLEQEKVARERLQQEVLLARQIQESFLPDKLPSFPGWDIDVRWQTARQVGGDFYDIFLIGKDTLGLVIADVSDKGMPAALYMTVTRTLIRAFAKRYTSPTRVFRQVNEQLLKETPNSLFVTGLYAILDLISGKLVYCNAGHNLPILLQKNTSELCLLEKGGIALGVVEDGKLADHFFQLESGDILMLYTDGVTDTFSSTGEQYGDERLYEALKGGNFSSVHAMLEHIRNQLDAFRGNAPIEDDLTILAIKKTK
jgi:serine phosphatase RsbU (regulator of sigma subunit)/putative methionine-R-sulfoxide reductase with GAF domain